MAGRGDNAVMEGYKVMIGGDPLGKTMLIILLGNRKRKTI